MKSGMIANPLTKKLLVILLISLLSGALAGCLGSGTGESKITAIVTIVPQEQMVKAIGGERVEVIVMVPYGQSPHTYEPLPSQMIAVEGADVYFEVGSGIEFELQKMDAITEINPGMLIVNCSEGVELKCWDEHLGGDIEGENDHDSGVIDPHIWLSPSNMKIMAQNVFSGLIEVDPAGENYYEINLEAYLTRIDSLISNITEFLTPFQNRSFLAYHPSWGYFSDEFGLKQIAIEEAGRQPGTSGIAAIIEQAKEENISVVVVSPQFDQSSAEVIAEEIGGIVIQADPLMLDYFTEMENLAAKMAIGFGGGG